MAHGRAVVYTFYRHSKSAYTWFKHIQIGNTTMDNQDLISGAMMGFVVLLWLSMKMNGVI